MICSLLLNVLYTDTDTDTEKLKTYSSTDVIKFTVHHQCTAHSDNLLIFLIGLFNLVKCGTVKKTRQNLLMIIVLIYSRFSK